jgi:hypothetical protein
MPIEGLRIALVEDGIDAQKATGDVKVVTVADACQFVSGP